MGSPQNPRARAREKTRRARKNALYDAKKAAEATASPGGKQATGVLAKSAVAPAKSAPAAKSAK